MKKTLLLGLLLLLPFVAHGACGPALFLQVPIQGHSYNGPTILEGDVYAKDVAVTVAVDGKPLAVTLTEMNPGPKAFYRWATTKYRTPGWHTASIIARDATGATTVETIRFRMVISGP